MHQIREVLRLHLDLGLSRRQVARSLGVSRGVVGDVVQRAQAAHLSWPPAEELTDAVLDELLFPGPHQGRQALPEPDFGWVHREMRQDKDVTLQLCWQEYKEQLRAGGLQYSQFCLRYREWEKRLDIVLRQRHVGGEKLFVDYAGRKVPIVDRQSGEVWDAPLFVCTLGASNYTYAELTRGEDLRSFLMAHVRAFAFFGGVPLLLVPDNLKAGVTQSSRYEPEINRAYDEMAAHYGAAVLPTRARKPRDKAKVEVAVQVAQRWLLAALRHRVFFSLEEANSAVRDLLERLNQRPFQKLEGSRRSQFALLDQSALRPLPTHPYEFALRKVARVNIDCHVEFEHNLYSAPHALVQREVELRVTDKVVEVLFHGERVASHARSYGRGQYRTTLQHLPEAHRRHLEWTPTRLIAWGEEIGPNVGQLVAAILQDRPHPEQGYRSCLGIMHLGRSYSGQRLETASERALTIGAKSYRSLKSILETGLDQRPLTSDDNRALPAHENVRGPGYYDDRGNNAC
ncbi:MAG: IS21 family transposase [Candidatus Xenobia bacterium]